MRAVWLSVPEAFLEERRRLGHDKKDELWDGELHMVPPPSSRHVLLWYELLDALAPIAKRHGLRPVPDSAGLFGPGDNWRIPDGMLVRPEMISDRGVEHAELVIEVLSPDDESYAKLPWYAQIQIPEVWIIDPGTRALEVYALVAGTQRLLRATTSGVVSPLLGIRLEVVAGPKLRLHDGDTFTDV